MIIMHMEFKGNGMELTAFYHDLKQLDLRPQFNRMTGRLEFWTINGEKTDEALRQAMKYETVEQYIKPIHYSNVAMQTYMKDE